MCRLLAYLGSPVQPNRLIYAPEHSLEVQSYRPQETMTTSVNADGVGLGWYHPDRDAAPFTYKNILPIWADINLPHLSRYIQTDCFLAYIRSATPGQPSSLVNCQPFTHGPLVFTHNGAVRDFRDTLYQPIRKHLTDKIYRTIEGTTDSEHIFALIANELEVNGDSLEAALQETLKTLTKLAACDDVTFSANVVVSDGHRLVASRFARGIPAPSLYWLPNDSTFPDSVVVASEPLFPGDWMPFEEDSLLCVEQGSSPRLQPIEA
ncbi:MAG: ergothioneine biosynthesis protein EgtC [Elainellaceae cyanobacterium]